jgi:hypothetical protein
MTGDFRIFLPLVIVLTALGGAFLSAKMDVSAAQAATTSERCLRTRVIQSIRWVDPNTVNVTMRNGSTYTNTLRSACNVHRPTRGFSFRTISGHLCKGDRIRAVDSGEACTLGSFERQG